MEVFLFVPKGFSSADCEDAWNHSGRETQSEPHPTLEGAIQAIARKDSEPAIPKVDGEVVIRRNFSRSPPDRNRTLFCLSFLTSRFDRRRVQRCDYEENCPSISREAYFAYIYDGTGN